MGYSMTQQDSNFTIRQQHHKTALAAIKKLITDGCKEGVMCRTSTPHYSWVSSSEVLKAVTLVEALEAFRWQPTDRNENGDILGIDFEGEKLGEDAVLFKVIAPYVDDGSYIEMQGEDGDQWRWCFDNGTMKEKHATVSW